MTENRAQEVAQDTMAIAQDIMEIEQEIDMLGEEISEERLIELELMIADLEQLLIN